MHLVKNKDIKLVNIKDASKYLAVSVNTLYQWKSMGKIPYVKLYGKLLFNLIELNEFIIKNQK